MKRSIVIIAVLALIGFTANAQDDRGAKPAPQKKEQPAQSDKVNPDGSLEAPVPASIATPEQLTRKQQQPADAKPAVAHDQKPSDKKPTAAPAQKPVEKKASSQPAKQVEKRPSTAADQKPADKKSTSPQKTN